MFIVYFKFLLIYFYKLESISFCYTTYNIYNIQHTTLILVSYVGRWLPVDYSIITKYLFTITIEMCPELSLKFQYMIVSLFSPSSTLATEAGPLVTSLPIATRKE